MKIVQFVFLWIKHIKLETRVYAMQQFPSVSYEAATWEQSGSTPLLLYLNDRYNIMENSTIYNKLWACWNKINIFSAGRFFKALLSYS